MEDLESPLMASPSVSSVGEEKEKKKESILVKALDDLAKVNSLLATWLLVRISLATPDQHSLENRPECDADPGLAMSLVLFEVIAIGLFLLSTLVAKATKLHIYIHNDGTNFLLIILILFSAIASLLGVVFLTLSMVDVIQIKVGKLACGSQYALRSVVSFVGIIIVALLVYMVIGGRAIYLAVKSKFI